VLVEGGVINPIPVNCIKRTDGDMLVVVNVNANIPYQKPEIKTVPPPGREYSFKRKAWDYMKRNFNLFSGEKKVDGIPGYLTVMDKSIDIMQDRICGLTVVQQQPDIDVKVSRDAASTFEFYRAYELIEAGRAAYKLAKQHSGLSENH